MIEGAFTIGSGAVSTGLTVSLVTTEAVEPGDAIVLIAATEGGRYQLDPAVPVSDDAGHQYELGAVVSTEADPKGLLQVARCLSASGMPSGSHITATFGTSGRHLVAAIRVPGGVTALVREVTDRGVSAEPLTTSGVLGQRNNTLALFALLVLDGKSDLAFADDEAVAALGQLDSPADGAAVLRWSYRVPESAVPVVYSPDMSERSWLAASVVLRGEAAPMPRSASTRSGWAMPAPPIVETEYGFQYPTNQRSPPGTGELTYLKVLASMPSVKHFRLGSNPGVAEPAMAAIIDPLAALGVKAVVNWKNRLNVAGALSTPVADPAAYKAVIKARLTRFAGQISWWFCENEFNTGNNYVQWIAPNVPATDADKLDRAKMPTIARVTAAAILEEVTLCYQAVTEWNAENAGVHPPVRVAAGGLSSSGIKMGRWWDLWSRGYADAAEDYANVMFIGRNEEGVRLSDLPNRQYPDRVPLLNNPKAWLNLLQLNELLAGLRTTEMKVASVHLIPRAATCVAAIEATRWAVRALGMPCVADAIGSKDGDPLTAAGIAAIGQQLGLEFVSVFAGEGEGNAKSFVDAETGTLNTNGQVLNAIWSGHPELVKDIIAT